MPRTPAPRFGIGEWYGKLLTNLSVKELNEYGSRDGKRNAAACPFRQASFPGEACNKKGGVCSLRLYQQTDTGVVLVKTEYGMVTVCPRRFWDRNSVFKRIGETLLGCSTPILINEVGFLKNPHHAPDGEGANVGKIDMVLVNAADHTQWCAVELQAVYFSGAGMTQEFARYANVTVSGPVFPAATRRPDFRSSGPKRLMPQLEIKVPTIRRWGKKTAVVVDKAFFGELAPMKRVEDVSNSDIAWFIVDYESDTGRLRVDNVYYTTLESSVEGLTAGIPVPLPVFEDEVKNTLDAGDPRKVIRID